MLNFNPNPYSIFKVAYLGANPAQAPPNNFCKVVILNADYKQSWLIPHKVVYKIKKENKND